MAAIVHEEISVTATATPAPGSALAALRRDQGADALAQLGDASTCDAFLADDDACAFLAVACERAARTRLRVRLELRAGGGLEALAALVRAAPAAPGRCGLRALAGDAAGARALARRGAPRRHEALDDGRTSDAGDLGGRRQPAATTTTTTRASSPTAPPCSAGRCAGASGPTATWASARGRQCINQIFAAHADVLTSPIDRTRRTG